MVNGPELGWYKNQEGGGQSEAMEIKAGGDSGYSPVS